MLVNLSRDRQPVTEERFHKNRTLASSYLNHGTTSALSTQPFRLFVWFISV